MALILRVENLSYEEILQGVSFKVFTGEILAILGPNGAGKTTLFRCLARLLSPSSGEVFLAEKPLRTYPSRQLYRLLTLCPQTIRLSFDYRVETVVLMGRTPYLGPLGAPSPKDREKVHQILAFLGLEPLAKRPFSTLSGGQQRLVMVARALAQEASLLLLDEPTAHLDLRHQILVLDRICKLAREKGLTLILNLHDPNLALVYAHRILALKQGRIIGEISKDPSKTPEILEELYEIPFQSFTNGEQCLFFPGVNPAF